MRFRVHSLYRVGVSWRRQTKPQSLDPTLHLAVERRLRRSEACGCVCGDLPHISSSRKLTKPVVARTPPEGGKVSSLHRSCATAKVVLCWNTRRQVPCAVDWDGDGDTDLLVGCSNGTVAYYERTPQGPGIVVLCLLYMQAKARS